MLDNEWIGAARRLTLPVKGLAIHHAVLRVLAMPVERDSD
jgi:hypothetical protein